MIKRHKVIAYLKDDEWKRLWTLKSDVIQKPFSNVFEKLINEYFEKHHLVINEDIKKTKED